MKYRKHFVTNSSSSCFVAIYRGNETCIDELKKKIKRYRKKKYVAGKNGSLLFEGHFRIYDDFDSRLNFVCLTILQHGLDFDNHPIGTELCSLFEERVGIPLDTDYITKLYNKEEAHIDHESCSTDSLIFNGIFDGNGNSLERFLFGEKSLFIQGWDDVDGEDEKYCNNPEYESGFVY